MLFSIILLSIFLLCSIDLLLLFKIQNLLLNWLYVFKDDPQLSVMTFLYIRREIIS